MMVMSMVKRIKRWLVIGLLMIFLFFYHSVNSETLGQISVIHKGLGAHTVVYEAAHGYAIAEGDILLGRLQPSSSTMKASIIKFDAYWWPQGIVPYQFDAYLPDANKKAVLNAITLWEQDTNIHFIERTELNRSLYPDYVLFMPESGGLCASHVGRQGGSQIVLLSTRCDTMITAHELGHVLGLWHEQSRLDRDNYIRIIWDNIIEKSKYNFDQHLTDGIDHGPYNYQSVMHYSAYAFSKNGEKTIVPLIEGITIGQRRAISPLDKAAINAIYPLQE